MLHCMPSVLSDNYMRLKHSTDKKLMISTSNCVAIVSYKPYNYTVNGDSLTVNTGPLAISKFKVSTKHTEKGYSPSRVV